MVGASLHEFKELLPPAVYVIILLLLNWHIVYAGFSTVVVSEIT